MVVPSALVIGIGVGSSMGWRRSLRVLVTEREEQESSIKDARDGGGATDAGGDAVAESADAAEYAAEGTVEVAVEELSKLWADLKGWD